MIDAIGWAVLLVWIGVVLFVHASWTTALFGIAGIILLSQLAILIHGDRANSFSATLGIALLLGAIAKVSGMLGSIVPIMLMTIGIAMLATALLRKGKTRPVA